MPFAIPQSLIATASEAARPFIRHGLLGVILAISVLIASTLPSPLAFATDIPYSKGVITIDDSRKVTIGVHGDYVSCVAAVQSFIRGGRGGTIEFLPGDHNTQCGAVHGRGTFLITGRLAPNGDRPRVTTEERIAPNGQIKKHAFLGFKPNAQDYLVVENLEIKDSEGGIDAANFGGVVIRNVFVNGTTGESGIAARQPHPTIIGKFPMWMEIYDTEVSRAGAHNIRHNLYLNRIDRIYIDGLYTHSSRGSHALKIVTRDVTVRNSTFATTDQAFKDIRSDDLFLSTTLLDIAGCANSLIENNKFVGVHVAAKQRSVRAWGGSTHVMVDVRRRRTMVQGCDDPVIGSDDYSDPKWWARAKAGGYAKSNKFLRQHIVRNNEFINIGTNNLPMVHNKGTAPIEDSPGKSGDMPLPPGWFERSVVWAENNRLQGRMTLGREFPIHKDYPGTAPIFIDGVRLSQ